MSDRVRCDLCGFDGHPGRDIRERIVEWTEAVQQATGNRRWDSVHRCLDFQACRSRVESAGGTWPVRDAVTRPTVRRPQQREEVPV